MNNTKKYNKRAFGLGVLSNPWVLLLLVGSMGTVYRPSNLVKHRFLDKFGSHSIIYIFKNYFVIFSNKF